MQIEVQSLFETDDKVAAEVRFSGTHTGPLAMPGGELPPSGKRIEMPAADFITVANGQITAWRVYIDMGTFMRQLGLSPEPAQTAPA
jgi:predicted ester cyclase